jgi:histidinol-phosphatase (PHP family)
MLRDDRAAAGRMEAMCRRALKIGLPALAFTEHLDLTGWVIDPEDLLDHLRPLVGDNGLLLPEPLNVAGYLDSVGRCRRQFPELRILSGVEFGQPHIDADRARQLLDLSALERVNGSLHTLPISNESGALRCEPITLYRQWPAERVIWEYLAEARRMIAGSDIYDVLSHIEYAVRNWPARHEGPFNPSIFEEVFRQVMRELAGSGRALELNVGGRLRPWIPQWWSEEGGRAITLRAMRLLRTPWRATSTKQWQWRSVSASAKAVSRKTSGPADSAGDRPLAGTWMTAQLDRIAAAIDNRMTSGHNALRGDSPTP